MLPRGGFRMLFPPRRPRRGGAVTFSWRLRAALVVLLAGALGLMNLEAAQGASAAARGGSLPSPAKIPRVALSKQAKGKAHEVVHKPVARFDPTGRVVLPAEQTATVALAKPAASGSRQWARAGTTPIFVAATTGTTPGSVAVHTTGADVARRAGVHGVMFTLRSPAGRRNVGVRVDDSSFRDAYGGDYAARLHLVELPSCAATTPELPKCQTQTPLTTSAGRPLTGNMTASAAAVVLAATSSASGNAGDYTATSLSPGGTWSVAGNTGSYDYSYPISVPQAVGGAKPSVSLDYDSSSQDARTEGTNDQSSWLGDGWSTGDSYIERTYKACSDVSGSGAPTGDGDLCWSGQILTMSLNGTSTPIVYDDATKTFRPASDRSTIKIEDLPGAPNGTANGEHFRVTENGVQYYFGLDQLPKFASGDAETRSAWTVPVYQAHGGVSACPDGSFAATACALGYRFNLDYVVDPHGNATAYYYNPETGYYGANGKNTAVAYTRGGTLDHIDYGMTASTIYSAPAPARIDFSTAQRCLPGTPAGATCSDDQFTVAHPEYWPDTPVDLNCTSGTDCTNHSPSFWSRLRLTRITTQVRVGSAAEQVDRYDFTQSFPDNGDNAPTLWLDTIQHTGLDTLGGAGVSQMTPPVTFYPTQYANRVGTIPSMPRMYHQRLSAVVSEAGAETDIVYDTPNCAGLPSSDTSDASDTVAQAYAATNTTGCFPVYWTPVGPAESADRLVLHPPGQIRDHHGQPQSLPGRHLAQAGHRVHLPGPSRVALRRQRDRQGEEPYVGPVPRISRGRCHHR